MRRLSPVCFFRFDTNAPAFNISDTDCLRLRTEAHGLLSNASTFLTRCLASFTGHAGLCCNDPTCRDRRLRCKNLPDATGADGLPPEWARRVTEPLLCMDSATSGPGYVGDSFIRAMAILHHRDIVVLSERPCAGFAKPGAKIFYADQTWFGAERTRCRNKASVRFTSTFQFVSDWDALAAVLSPGVSSTAVYPLRDAIQAKIDARDADGLGAMLLAFFSSGKAHLG